MLKAQIVAECGQPGVSIADVALSHGVNATLVHKWIWRTDVNPNIDKAEHVLNIDDVDNRLNLETVLRPSGPGCSAATASRMHPNSISSTALASAGCALACEARSSTLTLPSGATLLAAQRNCPQADNLAMS